MKFFIIFCLLFLAGMVNAQTNQESDIDIAVQNAKKGIYWALNNIPEKKNRLDNDLIAEDKLFATIKLSKEINGVKVESTGFYDSYVVTIKLFRSNESLEKDGYINKKEGSEKSEEEK